MRQLAPSVEGGVFGSTDIESVASYRKHGRCTYAKSFEQEQRHSWWNMVSMVDRFTSIHLVKEGLCFMESRYPSTNGQIQEASEGLWIHAYQQVLAILIRVIGRCMNRVA